MSNKIKFGTDGWRAIIARDFTTDNVRRVSEGVSRWLHQQKSNPIVVIGHDCRFGGKLFLEEAAKVFVNNGIKVYFSPVFVSTPMVSLGTRHLKADLGVVITASHNPPEYNGYKLKGSFGGPLLPDDILAVENLIPDHTNPINENILYNNPLFIKSDLRDLYLDAIKNTFNLEAINQSPFRFGFDAMYGAGQYVMNTLFPEIELLHCTENPGFEGIAPEPILRNLTEFSDFIRVSEAIDCGLATDGDADRIGLFDDQGNFVDSHHIILLLIHYLVHYKKQSGKVITAFSVSEKIKKICSHYNLEQHTTPIGFKNITGFMLNEDILLGGEESGGIAIKGHIPERDGIWMGLIIWEFMAETGKTLRDLIDEVYQIVGPFAYDRLDLHLTEELKQHIVAQCKNGAYQTFGNRRVKRTEDIDGYKFLFENDDWLLIRASGTEPLLRIYAETSTADETQQLLHEVRKTIGA
ncbi:MAG: phosphoglucomutase/phosphomannomutase family protein [Candidatus Competibacteraceae bacterium]|nr:phosphoglucomutase/phosphomannomutase family protein [Candidatus Competibacteraceae bacterium]